jgi:hypothetical protein
MARGNREERKLRTFLAGRSLAGQLLCSQTNSFAEFTEDERLLNAVRPYRSSATVKGIEVGEQ